MPRGVLGWLRCELCGLSPAPLECGGLRVCFRCFYTASPALGCGGSRGRAGRRASVDVDEELLGRVIRRASSGGVRSRH